MPNPELGSSSKLKLVIDDNKQTGEQKFSLSIDGMSVDIQSFSPAEKLKALGDKLASTEGLPLNLNLTKEDGSTETISVVFQAHTNEDKEMVFLLDEKGEAKAFFEATVEQDTGRNISKGFFSDQDRQQYSGKGLMKYALSMLNVHLRAKEMTKNEAYISKNNPDRRASLASQINAPNLIEGGYNTITSRRIGNALYLYADLSSSQPNPPDFDELVKLLES